MTEPSPSDSYKQAGNKYFADGEYQKALEQFDLAIEADPNNHILYSNRSGTWLALEIADHAIEDALQCIELKPEWIKGYTRLGAAHLHAGDIEAAQEAYLKAKEIDPDNAMCKNGLASCARLIEEEQAEAEQQKSPSIPAQAQATAAGKSAANGVPDIASVFGKVDPNFMGDIASKMFEGMTGGNGNSKMNGDMMSAISEIMKNPQMMELAQTLAMDPEVQHIMKDGPEKMFESVEKIWKGKADQKHSIRQKVEKVAEQYANDLKRGQSKQHKK